MTRLRVWRLVMSSMLAAAPRPTYAQAGLLIATEIRDSIEAWRTRVGLPAGLAVGVSARGSMLFSGGFGTARFGETVPVTPRTIFHLASVTKPFVATAVMQLVERGKVAIDSPVTKYLPYFRMADPRAASITVKEVLNHTSGIPDVTDYRWDHPEYDDGALERYVRGLADSSLVFDPGTKYKYSNIGFEVLADLIAKVSGEPFELYIQRHILAPLGMRHSTLLMTDVDSTHLAAGTIRDSGTIILSPHYPYNRPHAASSTLHSDVDDMLRWGNATLRGGELDGHRVITAATARQMATTTFDRTAEVRAGYARDHLPMPYDSMGVALSWFVSWRGGQKTLFHRGGDVGFRSLLSITPDDSTVVVVLMNNSAVGDPQEVERLVRRIVAAHGTMHP